MIVLGAKGFAKEVLEILYQNDDIENLKFYDDVSTDIGDSLFRKFEILKSYEAAADYFKNTDSRFTIGIGNPVLRKKLCDKFQQIGGIYTSTISTKSTIGRFEVEIG